MSDWGCNFKVMHMLHIVDPVLVKLETWVWIEINIYSDGTMTLWMITDRMSYISCLTFCTATVCAVFFYSNEDTYWHNAFPRSILWPHPNQLWLTQHQPKRNSDPNPKNFFFLSHCPAEVVRMSSQCRNVFTAMVHNQHVSAGCIKVHIHANTKSEPGNIQTESLVLLTLMHLLYTSQTTTPQGRHGFHGDAGAGTVQLALIINTMIISLSRVLELFPRR